MTGDAPSPDTAARRGWEHTRTARLWLDLPVAADVDVLHAIHADPATWRHFPSGRHRERATSRAMLETGLADWAREGLGFWSVRDAEGGQVVGRGGCVHRPGRPWWNLYYRFAASVHGRGYGAELAVRAIRAAHDVAPERPVLASLLEHNVGSHRTALRAGLREAWRGPDRDHPDAGAVRLVLLDREPSAAERGHLERQFGDPGAS